MLETKHKAWRRDVVAKKLRGFAVIQPVLSILVMPMGFVLWGLATIPGIYLFREVGDATVEWVEWQQLLALGATIGIGESSQFLSLTLSLVFTITFSMIASYMFTKGYKIKS